MTAHVLCLAAWLIPPDLPTDYEYEPQPLPAWVDALDLRTVPQFVNDRVLGQPWSDTRPAVKVGDVTRAIPEDDSLVLRYMAPINKAPAGRRMPGESEVILMLASNGFVRTIGLDKQTNWPDRYVVTMTDGNGTQAQFNAWQTKMTSMWGPPTVVSRTERPSARSRWARDLDAFEAIEDPTTYGHNYVSLFWVWGRGEPHSFRWRDDALSDGPTMTVIVTYAAETHSIDPRTGQAKKVPGFVQLWINPYGIMSG